MFWSHWIFFFGTADSQLTVWYEPALSLQLPVTGSTSDLSCQILFTSPMLSQTPRGNQAQSRDVGAKRLVRASSAVKWSMNKKCSDHGSYKWPKALNTLSPILQYHRIFKILNILEFISTLVNVKPEHVTIVQKDLHLLIWNSVHRFIVFTSKQWF